ncbi:hypothetical protein EUGRSUZ_E03969 [Eucalyptus grandis]|uniref:F-box domain-containing protein n=2 Tax=Eucalyptus grandis TaxID=71139 RepID=A0A059C9S2_EUCGR|nr:hypothetical protein EUGRSUZ_E03969 [Eucalyptus grandis]
MESPFITEILNRLPVKSLLQCRCVCTRWRCLIDSRPFMESHLNRSIESSTNLCFCCRGSSSLYCIDLVSPGDVVEIEYPLRWKRIKALGSCHTQIGGGLYPSACVHGFGYDDENDDYVLLRLIQTFEEPIESVVSIYSLRANEWRQLQEMPYYLVSTRKMMGVFVHGRLHWLMKRELVPNSAKVLVAFDFRIEEFVEVHQLNFIDNRLDIDLAVLGRPWDMLFSMPNHSRPLGLVRPLAYSQNGREVLVRVGTETLRWHDLPTGHDRRFDIIAMPFLEAEICLQTLVPVD